jgi:hypothetical protein
MTLSFSLVIRLNDHASGAAKILSAERCSMTTHGRGDGVGAPRTAVVIAFERDSTESGTNREAYLPGHVRSIKNVVTMLTDRAPRKPVLLAAFLESDRAP